MPHEKTPFYRSLRYRLFAGLLTILGVMIIAGGLFFDAVLRETIEKNIESELQNSTAAILNTVRTAASVSVKNRLRAIAEKNKEIAGHVWTGHLAGEYDRATVLKRIRGILLSQDVGKTGYIYCIDSRGTAVVHPKAGVEGENWIHFGFVKDQIAQKEGYLEYLWRNPGEKVAREKALYMSYFEPLDWIISVSAYKEEFLELVDVEDFRQSVLSYHFGSSGYAYVVDIDGNTVIHPALNKFNVYDATDMDLQFFDEMVARKSGRISYFWKNPNETAPREKITVFNYLPELKWLVAASVYKDEMFHPLAVLRRMLAVSAAVAFVAALVVVYLLTGDILNPLQVMREAFAKGAEGDFSVRLPSPGRDEIAQLSAFFNNFMEKLETYYTKLNNEIQERRSVEADLTESRRKIAESEARYRALFDSSPDGIATTTLDGRFIAANRAFLDMVGYELEELIRLDFNDITPPEYHAQERHRIENRFLRGETAPEGSPYEKAYITKTGLRIPVQLRGWLIRDDAGRPVAMGAFIRNISQEKTLLAEKKALELQLQQAQKIEAIGTLAAGIAHDFNNILSGINGYAELLIADEGTTNDRGKNHYARRILDAGNRARDLVNQILQFSRRAQTEKRPVKAARLIREVIALLEATLPKTIAIRSEIRIDRELILADATQIHQTLMNLSTNAYHAMRTTGGELTIRAEAYATASWTRSFHSTRLTPGDYIRISVTDTGCGMTPETIDRIFEPYFTTKGTGEGTGLGLSVTLGIINAHGGAIDVQSTPGKGSTFSIYLPLVDTLPEERPADGDEAIPAGNGETILIVDDERFFREAVGDILKGLGYRVVSFASSIQAMEYLLADAGGVDLVITDQTMPEMTGLQFSAEIRKIREETPIILCSGYSEQVTPETVAEYRLNAFLMKPASRREIAETVRNIFDAVVTKQTGVSDDA